MDFSKLRGLLGKGTKQLHPAPNEIGPTLGSMADDLYRVPANPSKNAISDLERSQLRQKIDQLTTPEQMEEVRKAAVARKAGQQAEQAQARKIADPSDITNAIDVPDESTLQKVGAFLGGAYNNYQKILDESSESARKQAQELDKRLGIDPNYLKNLMGYTDEQIKESFSGDPMIDNLVTGMGSGITKAVKTLGPTVGKGVNELAKDAANFIPDDFEKNIKGLQKIRSLLKGSSNLEAKPSTPQVKATDIIPEGKFTSDTIFSNKYGELPTERLFEFDRQASGLNQGHADWKATQLPRYENVKSDLANKDAYLKKINQPLSPNEAQETSELINSMTTLGPSPFKENSFSGEGQLRSLLDKFKKK